MVENLWASIPHQASGSLAEKGRLEGVVRLLSQSPSARALLQKAHENGVVMTLSPLAGPTNSLLGMPRSDARMLVLDPRLDDASCALQVVQQLAAAEMTGFRPSARLALRPFAIIRHAELARAHGAAMACQVAHELKDGHSGFRSAEPWNAVAATNPALAGAYASAAAVPGADGTGQAASAAFFAALADKAARERTEDMVMNHVLVRFSDEQAPSILFRKDVDVVATATRLQAGEVPYVQDPQRLAEPEQWAVSPLTADKIRFFGNSHPELPMEKVPVRPAAPMALAPSGLRGTLGRLFNAIAAEVAAMSTHPKLAL